MPFRLKRSNVSVIKPRCIKMAEFKKLVYSLSTILIYYFFSISLTFYNRYLFVTYKYPLSITIFHLIVKFFACALLRAIYNTTFKMNKRLTLSWPVYVRRIVPTGIASAADIGLSNWSLQYITISLYTMSKSTVILFIFFFSVVFKLEKWRRSMTFIIICISTGLLLFTYHSTEFHLFGFILVMCASVSAGIRWTLAQAVTQKKELGLSNPIDMMYHIQPGMIICLLPLAVAVEGVSLISSEKFFRTDDYSSIMNHLGWVLVGAVLAFFLESSEYLVVSCTSSITLSISGIFKEICTIYLAVIWNNNKLHLMNTIGLVICLLGIIIHVFFKIRDQMQLANEATKKAKDSNATLIPRKENRHETSLYADDILNNSRPLLQDADEDIDDDRHQFN